MSSNQFVSLTKINVDMYDVMILYLLKEFENVKNTVNLCTCFSVAKLMEIVDTNQGRNWGGGFSLAPSGLPPPLPLIHVF